MAVFILAWAAIWLVLYVGSGLIVHLLIVTFCDDAHLEYAISSRWFVIFLWPVVVIVLACSAIVWLLHFLDEDEEVVKK